MHALTTRARALTLAVAGVVIGSGLSVLQPPAIADTSEVGPAIEVTRVALPALPEGQPVVGVALDGPWAYVGLPSGTARATLHRTASDGSGSWEAVVDPATGTALEFLRSTMPAIEQGVILARLPNAVDIGCRHRLITASSHRTLTGCATRTLAVGASAVVGFDPDVYPNEWTIEDLEGSLLDEGVTEGRPPLVANGEATGPLSGTAVVTRPVGSTTASRTHALPLSCTWPVLVGRRDPFLVVRCGGDNTAVLRTDTSLPPFPVRGAGPRTRLGHGFLLHATDLTAVVVTDLGGGGASITLPGALARDPEPDRRDHPAFVTVDPDNLVEVATVAGLSPPVTNPADVVAPTIDAVTGPGPATSNDRPLFTWSGADPGHPNAVAFQTRTRSWRAGASVPDWSSPQETAYTRLESPVTRSGHNVCLEVRAVDWAGNVSGWSRACTLVDREEPAVHWSRSYGQQNLVAAPASEPLRVAWTSRDNDRVASYDVDYRISRDGQALSGWVSPRAWDALTVRSVSRVFPPGSRVCFRVFARDRAGLRARSFDTPCFSIPYDDRAFTPERAARRLRTSAAYGGTVTLMRPGDTVVRAGIRAKAVKLRFLGDPDGACVSFFIAGIKHTRCLYERDESATYFTMQLPRHVEGALRIKIGPNIDPSSPRNLNRVFLLDAVYLVSY